jgi:Mn-dependent DtxR family transcriptional regulator
MNHSASSRDKSKSPGRHLSYRLEDEVGLSPAQAKVAIEIFTEHLSAYCSESRPPGEIIHTAVSIDEPPGKPIRHCKVVPVRLTYFHEDDPKVLREEGTVEAREVRLLRLCREAYEQKAPFSYEDLSVLLCIDVSTVRDLVHRLRDDGHFVPTRGAVKDIGPEPSHKQVIARLLCLGYTTSKIRAMTNHSEGSIGRYQQQLAQVLYLLHHYPQASHGERCTLCGLSRPAYDTYVEVYKELAERDDCQPHLERLRRRYELDPGDRDALVPPAQRRSADPNRRLGEQTLGTAIRQTIEIDLGTTRRVAETVTEDLMGIINTSFQIPNELRPGEAVIYVDAYDPSFVAGEKVSDRPVIPVSIPLHTQEVLDIWRSEEPAGRRRARIAALIASAAHEQGGIMAIAGLAELLHTAPSTLSKDLRKLAVELHIDAATKGLLEDAGSKLTHKELIVGLDQFGLTGEEISWLTRHAPCSRDRYIETFRRAQTLMRLEGRLPDAEHLARALDLRLHVAKQYADLLKQHHGDSMEPHPSENEAA